MEKETLKKIFDFLEEKENKKHKESRSLKWKLFFNKSITKEELNVNGDLNLRGLKIKSLPEGLKVGGALVLSYSNITSLPEGLKVGGSLLLVGLEIKLLPKGLYVGGSLHIQRSNFTNFSDDEIRDMIKPGFIKGKIYRK